jgi:hypothetical protein
MKHLAAALVSLAFSTAAHASPCGNLPDDLFIVESYSGTEVDRGFGKELRLEFIARNQMDRGVRMIKGTLHLVDVLGRNVAMIEFAPDTRIGPGKVTTQSGITGNLRYFDVDPQDIIAIACVSGVVHDDGKAVTF